MSRSSWPCWSCSDNSEVLTRGPGSLEGGQGNSLIAPGLDAAVVEVHQPGAGVDAGDHHDVVVVATVTSRVPDRLGVDGRDHLVLLGQILLEAPDGRLLQRGLHAVMRQQDRQVCDVGTHAATVDRSGARGAGSL